MWLYIFKWSFQNVQYTICCAHIGSYNGNTIDKVCCLKCNTKNTKSFQIPESQWSNSMENIMIVGKFDLFIIIFLILSKHITKT